MRLAIFGKTGQLARALRYQIEVDNVDAIFYSREDCDLSADPATIESFVDKMPLADVVIVAAAYTGVDQAEVEAEKAFSVNARAPAAIAAVCKRRSMPVIYISTDYVFDGKVTTPYLPDDFCDPLNNYGKSKMMGELAIRDSGCNGVVLRTSWIFDGTGRNFLTTILRRVAENKPIKVINDQIGRPTFSQHLAMGVLKAAQQVCQSPTNAYKIYHITNSGDPVSWAQFAKAIVSTTRSDFNHASRVEELSTREYGSSVARPAYSVLDISSFEEDFGFPLPNWTEGLEIAVQNWRNSSKGA